ncbi:MAG: hypothetical protein AB8G16_12385 [Gammaproteobacteria bacterium]
MSLEDEHNPTTTLIRQVAERLKAVIDEEAEAHEAICSLMMTLSMGDASERPELGQLVESLQYFDRLQQRACALCTLIQNLTAAMDMNDDPDPVAQAFCATAPVAQDAEWLSALQAVDCTSRDVSAANCETWIDGDATQTF